jgi:hypothetical protein
MEYILTLELFKIVDSYIQAEMEIKVEISKE